MPHQTIHRKANTLHQNIFMTLGGLTSPLIILPVLLFINSINPMQLVFLFSFKVSNATNQTLWITPIGTVGYAGRKNPLPLYLIEQPAFPSFILGGFRIDPGKTRDFKYDWDDINFSEIAVKDREGNYKQLVIDPNPTESMYRSPATDKFTIESFNSLKPIDKSILDAVRIGRYNFRILMVWFSSIVPVCFFALYSRTRLSPPT